MGADGCNMGAFALYGRITYLASKTLKKYHVYA
jgi:hypothetical protein